MNKDVILTGLRANNDLTIGNYFGAMLPMTDLAKNNSDKYQINMFVPDLHSFTTPIDHSQLSSQIMHNLKVYLACGLPIDNDSVNIYRQSYVPAHSELTWILDCFTGTGEMSRMTQFKDKSGKLGSDQISMGLYNYPVLMAADILLYNAKYVPVGDDQTQHLEFARDIAQRMNNRFGELFVVPEPVAKQHEFFGKDQGLRIMDLTDPSKKMSKSDEIGKGVIFLGDSPEIVHKKVMSATTDSLSQVSYDPKAQPGIANIIDLIALLDGTDKDQVITRYQGQTMYGPLKTELADKMAKFVGEFQQRLADVDEAKIVQKLQDSEVKMNQIANETLLRVQKAVGLR